MQAPPVSRGDLSVSPRVRRIIKLGGAAITVKNNIETLRPDVLDSTCRSIAGSSGSAPHTESSSGATVIVHGAGSFGHHQASQYNVAFGPITSETVKHGFSLTRASVTKLNGIVVSTLIQAGVHACGISPCGSWLTRNRQVVRHDVGAVSELLSAGLVPVLHGDAVMDTQLGCTILSGDTIMAVLAEQLRPEYVVFLTNVDGVYDRPPEEEGAQRLARITVHADGSWEAHATPTTGAAVGAAPMQLRLTAASHDTTGGIAKKVEEAAAIAKLGIPVLIARAGSASGEAACAVGPSVAGQGSDWLGTMVVLA